MTKKGLCGFDGGKKVKGRKRHILVDHFGLLISAAISVGSCGDRDGLHVLLYYCKQNDIHLPSVYAISYIAFLALA